MKKIFSLILLVLLMFSPCYAGVDFNGDLDEIDCGTSDTLSMYNNSEFTISAWVKLGAKTTDRPIVTRDINGVLTTIVYMLWWDAGDDLWEFFVRDVASGLHYAKMDSAPNIGQWYHLVAVWDGTDIYIYEDGVVGTTTSAITTILDDSTERTRIGRREENNTIFDGIINDVKIWNKGLTSTQALQEYTSKLKYFMQQESANLQMYLPMDDYSAGTAINGKTFNDASGNGNDGVGVDADADSFTTAEEILNYPPAIGQFN